MHTSPFPSFCAIARLLLGGALALLATQTHAAPKVVVSVLPVHSLVSALMRGVGDVQLLLPAGQSPHGAQLKPSQIKLLAAADLIVWVGPRFERSVDKAIVNRRGAASITTLMEEDEILLLPQRRGGIWESGAHHAHGEHNEHDEHNAHDEHDEHNEHDAHDEHDEHDEHTAHDEHAAQMDPHLWLSPVNAQAIARIVTRELVRLDAANRDRYESNARELLARIARLRQAVRARLHGVADLPYIVFHDAYHYFENEFDLHPAGALTISPELSPGAKRISRIHQTIRSRNVRCVFSEPQFPPGLVDTLVADTGVAAGVLDPLGAALSAGPDAWFQLMRAMADALAGCLEGE